MAVSATVRLDVSTEPGTFDNLDRRTLDALDRVPNGARVVVYVGGRRYPSSDCARWLRRHADRLDIEIQGTPDADIPAWLDAARGGRDWQVPA